MKNINNINKSFSRMGKDENIYVGHTLKNMDSFGEITKTIDSNPTIEKAISSYLYGNPFPSSYEVLGHGSNSTQTFDLKNEINWCLLAIRKYKDKINLFIEYKGSFEKELLVGNYNKAFVYLEKIENEICFSLWSMENRLLLLELSGSAEERMEYASNISKQLKGWNMPFILQYLNFKAEKGMSITRFDEDFKNQIKRTSKPLEKKFQEYFYFRFNFFEDKYQEFAEIINIDSFYSIIDRYLLLVRIFRYILTNELNYDNNIKKFINSRILYLNKKIKDDNLQQLTILSYPKYIKKSPINKEFIEPIENYFIGNYGKVISYSEKLIKKYPNQIENYILYIKSFILGDKEYTVTKNITSIQQKILDELYLIYSKNENPISAITNLNRLVKQLSFFNIATGLHYIISTEYYKKEEWDKFNYLIYRYDNPIFSEFLSMKDSKKLYLEELEKQLGNNNTISFFKIKENIYFDERDYSSLKIPKIRLQLEFGKISKNKNDYQRAYDYFKEVSHTTSYNLYKETCTVEMFSCLVELDRLDEAVGLYVNAFLSNMFNTQRIKLDKFFDLIKKNKFRNVTPNLELVLLYAFGSKDSVDKHQTYKRFLESYGVNKPSELIKVDDIEKDKLKLFLLLGCELSILSRSTHFEKPIDLINEKLAILSHLIEIDVENKVIHEIEINQLNAELIILEGKRQFDESKIHVNEIELINELKEFEGLFDRYKTVSKLYKQNKSFNLLYSNNYLFFSPTQKLEKIDNTQSDNTYSNNPIRDIYKEIFAIIRQKFLFSKSGISAYLSTRIRHGVLDTEIRPVFEKYLLVSLKENNKYMEIPNWNSKYRHLGTDKLRKLQLSFSIFSEEIDNIIQDILDHNLKINTEYELGKAWFDYYYEDENLEQLSIDFSTCKDYSEFVKENINLLWERTNFNLEQIRAKIKTALKEEFNNKINDFRNKLEIEFKSNEIPDIYTNLNNCSTELDLTLDKIATWFNRTGVQAPDFQIKQLVINVLSKVNNSSPKKQINLSINCIESLVLKGEFHINFIDVFRILFGNIIKHSMDSAISINAELVVKVINSKLIIELKNENPKIEVIERVDKTEEIQIEKLNTEGKSGMEKCKKIIKHDFNNIYNKLDFGLNLEEKEYWVKLELSIKELIYEDTIH